MRKIALVMLLVFASVGGGCTAFFTETNPERTWSQSRYRELRREDERRLEAPPGERTTVAGAIFFVPRQIWRGVAWTWNTTTGHSASRYARDLTHRNPDVRRKAIYALSDQGYGRRAPYTEQYANMANDDRDATVRAAAIRALNRARDKSQTGIYVASLTDENAIVRLEAAKALANIPDANAATPLVRLLADEQQSRDIRIAAADGLRAYRQSDVAQALIRVLDGRDFAVAWQARRSLNLMTARDFRYDPAQWLTYLTSTDQPFVQ